MRNLAVLLSRLSVSIGNYWHFCLEVDTAPFFLRMVVMSHL